MVATPELTPTASAGATARAVRELERRVLVELEPGADLPSESALARQLGVSRLTIREAIKGLQARGLVDVGRGRRARVAVLDARPIGDFFAAAITRDPSRLLELTEVRRALEVHIAGLAAVNAGRASITAMRAALDDMHATAGAPDTDALHAADVRFHEALAAASGNRLLDFLIEAIQVPLHASRLRSLRGHLARGGTVQDVVEQHERIFARVLAHDARGAAMAMADHLAQTTRDLRAAFDLSADDVAAVREQP